MARTPSNINPYLVNVLQNDGRATLDELGCSYFLARRIQGEGYITVKGTVKTGRKGRPAHIFALTDKGRKKAKRAAKHVRKAFQQFLSALLYGLR